MIINWVGKVMSITVKKFCEICGKELKDIEEVVYTCSDGILDVREGYFCIDHKKDSVNSKKISNKLQAPVRQ